MGEETTSPADTLKDQGNKEFKAGNWLKAAAIYTKAIKDDPENSVLYRSAMLAANPLPPSANVWP